MSFQTQLATLLNAQLATFGIDGGVQFCHATDDPVTIAAMYTAGPPADTQLPGHFAHLKVRRSDVSALADGDEIEIDATRYRIKSWSAPLGDSNGLVLNLHKKRS